MTYDEEGFDKEMQSREKGEKSARKQQTTWVLMQLFTMSLTQLLQQNLSDMTSLLTARSLQLLQQRQSCCSL